MKGETPEAATIAKRRTPAMRGSPTPPRAGDARHGSTQAIEVERPLVAKPVGGLGVVAHGVVAQPVHQDVEPVAMRIEPGHDAIEFDCGKSELAAPARVRADVAFVHP